MPRPREANGQFATLNAAQCKALVVILKQMVEGGYPRIPWREISQRWQFPDVSYEAIRREGKAQLRRLEMQQRQKHEGAREADA